MFVLSKGLLITKESLVCVYHTCTFIWTQPGSVMSRRLHYVILYILTTRAIYVLLWYICNSYYLCL